MEKATDIIKYADINKLEEYMEHIEVKIHALGIKHQKDASLELEHSILSRRFDELLNETK